MERYKYLCILTGVQILFLFSIQSRPHGLGRLCRLGTLKSSVRVRFRSVEPYSKANY